MPQSYVPKDVKEVGEPDMHGNRGYSVLFTTNESVFMKAKTKAPEVGVEEYGEITNEPKRNNPDSTYKRFRRKQREEGYQPSPAQATIDSPTLASLERRVSALEAKLAPDSPSQPELPSKGHADEEEVNIDDIPF